MKKLIVGLAMLLSFVACGKNYTFVEGPMRITNFRLPHTIMAGYPYELKLVLAGVLYKDPVAIRLFVDGVLVGESRVEGLNSRFGSLRHVIPQSLYYEKMRRYKYDPTLPEIFHQDATEDTDPSVVIKIAFFALEYEDGKWKLGRRLAEKSRKVKLDCMECVAMNPY